MAIAKRKRYLIKKAFQIRYIAVVLFFILITATVASTAIYFAIFPYLSEKLANVYPQGRLVKILSIANSKVFISTIFVVPVAVWISVMLSHRIAGPWYRLELILRDMAEGNLTSEVKLRKGDELQSLADAINKVIINLRTMSQENIAYINSMDETLQTFEEELNKQTADPMKSKLLVSKLKEISEDLKTSLKRHKLS